MPGIKGKMHYLTEYTLCYCSLYYYYYYYQTYIAPAYILDL